MAQNRWKDKKGRMEIKPVTIETIDGAVFDYFDKKISLKVDTENGRKKVPIIMATGERWKIIRDQKNLRDDNGTLILPLMAVRRTEIDRTPGFGGRGIETDQIIVKKKIHSESGNINRLIKNRKKLGFPEKKREPIIEYFSIPYPDFATISYEIIIWAQYQSQMNEILERIFYSYDHMDMFTMPIEYDGNEPKGNSYYVVGHREGLITPQSNIEEFTDQERIIKYIYNIRVPVYFLLDPKDEALSYGDDEKGKKILFKSQSANDISYKEEILTLEEFIDKFGDES